MSARSAVLTVSTLYAVRMRSSLPRIRPSSHGNRKEKTGRCGGNREAGREKPPAHGDVVLLHSDGLTERRGPDLDRDSCHQLTGPHPEDDATVLAMRVLESGIGGR